MTRISQGPHPRVVALLELQRDPSRLPAWRDSGGTTVIEGSGWCDPEPLRSHDAEGAASGDRLRIRRDALLRVLAHEGLDLIINLTFSRWIGERDYGQKKDRSREREFDHIILLRHDGTIEARAGNLGRWA